MQKYNFFCYLKKKLYLCITISERVVALNDWKSGEVPEWSNGAVSKTVDQLAGPRVRIPASPLMKISQVPVGKLVRFFVSVVFLFFLYISKQCRNLLSLYGNSIYHSTYLAELQRNE